MMPTGDNSILGIVLTYLFVASLVVAVVLRVALGILSWIFSLDIRFSMFKIWAFIVLWFMLVGKAFV